MGSITRFIHDDNGADLVEYALLVGLVSLAAIVGLQGVAGSITGLFTDLKNAIAGVPMPEAGE